LVIQLSQCKEDWKIRPQLKSLHPSGSLVSMQRGLKDVGTVSPVWQFWEYVSMQRGLKGHGYRRHLLRSVSSLNAKRIERQVTFLKPVERSVLSQCKEDWKRYIVICCSMFLRFCLNAKRIESLFPYFSLPRGPRMSQCKEDWKGFSSRLGASPRLSLNAKRIERHVYNYPVACYPPCLNAKRIESLVGASIRKRGGLVSMQRGLKGHALPRPDRSQEDPSQCKEDWKSLNCFLNSSYI